MSRLIQSQFARLGLFSFLKFKIRPIKRNQHKEGNMNTFTVAQKLDLPSDQVWAIVSDFTRPPSPDISIDVEEKGNPDANGIGAIRNINIRGAKARERLESIDPPNSFTYSMLSGAPVKAYLGTVNVVAQNGTTLIN